MVHISTVTIKGFTLLEVLLAVAIFAMISLASFSIFDGVLKSDEHSKHLSEQLNQVQRAWLFIERDFLQLAKRSMRIEGEAPLSGFIHNNVELLASTEQAIAFVRQGWTNPGLLIPRSDMQSVAYRLNNNNLERLHFNFVDSVVGEQAKERILIQGISALSFEYYYDNEWQEELEGENLPLAVRVNITSDELGELHRQFLVSGELNSSSREKP